MCSMGWRASRAASALCRESGPPLKHHDGRVTDAAIAEESHGRQHPTHRLDRHGPHGLPHGRAPAQGRPRRVDLEPHARQGRAAGEARRQGRRQARRSRRAATSCSRSSRPARTWRRSISASTAWCTAATASCRPCSSTARPSRVEESAAIRARLQELGVGLPRRPVSGNAKVIKAGKLSAVASGPEGAVPPGRAADRGVRAAAACPTSARASSRASARSRTT